MNEMNDDVRMTDCEHAINELIIDGSSMCHLVLVITQRDATMCSDRFDRWISLRSHLGSGIDYVTIPNQQCAISAWFRVVSHWVII
jgi:hypothetical protein